AIQSCRMAANPAAGNNSFTPDRKPRTACNVRTHTAKIWLFYLHVRYADLASAKVLPMPPLVKATTGFDAPLLANLNVDHSARDVASNRSFAALMASRARTKTSITPCIIR